MTPAATETENSMANQDYQMNARQPQDPESENFSLDAACSLWDPWLIQMYVETLNALSRKAIH
jgi:hypothetical protein